VIYLDPTKSDATVGVHQFVLKSTLTNYAKTVTAQFTVTIDQCVITGMTVGQPSLVNYNYEIMPNPQQLVIPLPVIAMSPSSCSTDTFFGVSLPSGQVPSFVTVSQSPSPKLIINTTDPNDAGNYLINVLIKPQGPNTVQPVTLQYNLAIGRCYVNQFTVINNLD